MDIVIPLGRGSIWYNNELRYCLRSIQKNCTDCGKIIIIGHRPEWLQNVTHVPYTETARHELNIWHKALEACNHTVEFLFCNDDFFFLQPFSAASYPNYHAGDIADFLKAHKPANYYNIVQKTYRLIYDAGLPAMFYDIHRPMVINSAAFRAMHAHFNPQAELIMKSCYANYHRLPGQQTTDLKIGLRDAYKLKNPTFDMFSCADSLCGAPLHAFLGRYFSKKSKYEK